MGLRFALVIIFAIAGCGDGNKKEIKKLMADTLIKTSCDSCVFEALIERDEQGYRASEKAKIYKKGNNYLAVFSGAEKILIKPEGVYLINDAAKTAVFHPPGSAAAVFFTDRIFINRGEIKGKEIMMPPVTENRKKYEVAVYEVVKRPHGVMISAAVTEYRHKGTAGKITVTAPPYDAGAGGAKIEMPGIRQEFLMTEYKCAKIKPDMFEIPAGYSVQGKPK